MKYEETIEERIARLAAIARRAGMIRERPAAVCRRPAPAQAKVAPASARVELPAKPVVNRHPSEPPERDDDVVTARQFGQADFQASGAAASQNARLLEFFRQPQNFGLWFKGAFLEELSGASRMNNRAIDLRDIIKAQGLWIDNCMMRPRPGEGVVSCYRICRIADALCLSDEQKSALLEKLSQE